jgi:hypothetical protein
MTMTRKSKCTICTLTVLIATAGTMSSQTRRSQRLTEQQQPSETATQQAKAAEDIASSYPQNCEVSVPADSQSAIKFYSPFSPGDSLVDAWCKVGMLKSAEPIKVWLMTSEATVPIFTTNFVPNGVPSYSKADFVRALVAAIQRNNDAYFWRATQTLGSTGNPEGRTSGVPDAAPEGRYSFYTGSLYIEVRNVEIMGLKFDVGLTFTPNFDLVARRFSKQADYLHLPMSYTEQTQGRTVHQRINISKLRDVGFPWSFSKLSLQSTDPRVQVVGSEIKKSMKEKYAKWLKASDSPGPKTNDPNHRTTWFSDGNIYIGIDEGTNSNWTKGDTTTRQAKADTQYFQINYSPASNGPLAVGTSQFLAFVKDATNRYNKSIADSVKGKSPF